MQPEQLLLVDIIEAADAVAAFIDGCDVARFLQDYQLRSAVMFQLIIIGEAANRIAPEVRDRHPDVPWRDAIRLRHRAAHGYSSLDWNIIWSVAIRELPPLRSQIAAVYAAEFPGEPERDA